ncbi:MAG: AAA family ATPase [Burkholderiales bacterium PBB4]|nr:MAG: AAA family ATPase [Burkholderiales bacterium PBB4]
MTSSLDSLLARAETLFDRLDTLVPGSVEEPDWSQSIAFRYRRRKWGAGALIPVTHLALTAFETLKEIEVQKSRIRNNTAQFVQGLPANNVLLTGARGTGKSSLVKACLHAFHSHGLRLVEVEKSDMVDLPDVLEVLAVRPEKFIVYCDDLSFDEGEAGYKALKSALDGSISATSSNVLIYATSNRRHLLPEFHHENARYLHSDDGEVHPGEAVEEKISLSERFGLWISFYPFNQEEYLAIVKQWLEGFEVRLPDETSYRAEALVWALERGSRSGRVAWQFARDYAGRVGKDRL